MQVVREKLCLTSLKDEAGIALQLLINYILDSAFCLIQTLSRRNYGYDHNIEEFFLMNSLKNVSHIFEAGNPRTFKKN